MMIPRESIVVRYLHFSHFPFFVGGGRMESGSTGLSEVLLKSTCDVVCIREVKVFRHVYLFEGVHQPCFYQSWERVCIAYDSPSFLGGFLDLWVECDA